MMGLILMLRNKIDSEFHDCQTYLISPKVFDTQNIAVLILKLKQIDLTAEKCLQEIQKKMANSADLVQTSQSELVLHCLQTYGNNDTLKSCDSLNANCKSELCVFHHFLLGINSNFCCGYSSEMS